MLHKDNLLLETISERIKKRKTYFNYFLYHLILVAPCTILKQYCQKADSSVFKDSLERSVLLHVARALDKPMIFRATNV